MLYNEYRRLFVGLDTKVPLSDGTYSTYVNFDNAATTPALCCVMKKIINFMPWYSSIHRGKGYKSMLCSEIYDNSRNVLLDFVGADPTYHTVVYVKNTTEGINKLSYRLSSLLKNGVVLSTSMEHHSNDLPWRNKYTVDYVDIDSQGRLCIKDLQAKLKKYNGAVKLVTITGASNVTGYKNDINSIARIAHMHNAQILVDAAQLIAHDKIDIKNPSSKEHIDYLVFSAHKMYAPFGIGAIIGPRWVFDDGAPEYCGGGTVDIVTQNYVKWAHTPDKDEAGTPNVLGVVALVESIKALQNIGFKSIHNVESKLLDYTIKKLSKIEDILMYADCKNLNDRSAIIPFNMKGISDHNVVAKALSDDFGIGVRNGCFCAQPYIQKLLRIAPSYMNHIIKHPNTDRPGMIRISFGLYNSFEEINLLSYALSHISKNKEHYLNRYF